MDMLGTFAGQAESLRNWLSNAQINRDRNLRLQYLAGLGLTEWIAPEIYNQIVRHADGGGGIPIGTFVGSNDRLEALRAAIGRQRFQPAQQ
jgi:spermidine synthase